MRDSIPTGFVRRVVTRLRASALFAIVAAVAAYFVAPTATPIDRALPFVVLVLAAALFTTEGTEGAEFSVLSVILPAIFFADEHTRLLAYGIASSIVFTIAIINSPDERRWVHVIAGVLLLRWIPFSEVVVWRELIVLAGAVAVFFASRSVVLALALAAVTPAFPARVMVLLFVAAALLAILPRIRVPVPIRIPLYAFAFALFAMWPWSGVVARALPAFLRSEAPLESSRPVWIALARGESVSIDAPAPARWVEITASGANASRLRKGRLMGTVEVNGIRREIRIGDIADFGYTRREQFFRSHNRAPRRPLDDLKGYGQSAWLHTAGLIAISSPRQFRSIRVSAAGDLPADARLQIEAVAFE